MGGGDLSRAGRAHRVELEARSSPGGGDRPLRGAIQGRHPIHAIGRHDRGEHLDRTTRPHDRCDARERGFVEAQHAAQQRSPREQDRHSVGDAGERRVRQGLSTSRQEHHVAKTGPLGPSGRLGHGRRGRVNTEHERRGRSRGSSKGGPAVAGAEIHDHPLGAGDQVDDLADVDLEGTTPDDLTHGPQSTLGL